MDRMAILQAEYAKAFMQPTFKNVQENRVLLELLENGISEQREKDGWNPNA